MNLPDIIPASDPEEQPTLDIPRPRRISQHDAQRLTTTWTGEGTIVATPAAKSKKPPAKGTAPPAAHLAPPAETRTAKQSLLPVQPETPKNPLELLLSDEFLTFKKAFLI